MSVSDVRTGIKCIFYVRINAFTFSVNGKQHWKGFANDAILSFIIVIEPIVIIFISSRKSLFAFIAILNYAHVNVLISLPIIISLQIIRLSLFKHCEDQTFYVV